MNIARFISKKIHKQDKDAFSAIISHIAVGSVASGMFILITSYAILFGFQETIEQKIFSFGGHIQLTKYDLNVSLEESPIVVNPDFIRNAKKYPNVQSISLFSLKAGLIKTQNEIQGVVIRGVDKDFNSIFFRRNIKSGRFIGFSDSLGSKEIIISKKNASKLHIKLNDEVFFYFVQNPPKVRKLKIVGIYETGMEEFDETFVIGDLQLIRRVNHWSNNLAGGYDIMLKNMQELDNTGKFIFELMDYDIGMEKITDKYLAIFDWLQLLDQNVRIFLALITLVACFNMVSSLIIMVMEKTNFIGMLKALGATNQLITKIFFLNGLYLVFKGMVIGDLLAIAFCLLQFYFKIIPLDTDNYYMEHVPIAWHWDVFMGLNLGLLFVLSLVLVFPALVIVRIRPIKAIKFS